MPLRITIRPTGRIRKTATLFPSSLGFYLHYQPNQGPGRVIWLKTSDRDEAFEIANLRLNFEPFTDWTIV